MELTVIAATGPGTDQTPRPHRIGRGPTVLDAPGLRADAATLHSLELGAAGLDLAAPPVVLPDFHHKRNMEMPSSIAVATRGTIRPTFTSSSVNCGMALIALGTDRPDDRAVDEFYRAVRERYPYPTRGGRELTRGEVVAAATDGAAFAAERWGVDPDELGRIEESGRVDLDQWGGASRLRREVPALTWQLGAPPLRHDRPDEPLHRAPAGRGGPRPRGRRAARDPRGAGDAPVPRRGRGAHRRDRAPVPASTGHGARHAGRHGRAEAPLPPGHGALGGAAARADPALLRARLPARRARQRRGTAADARQRRRDELRLRLPPRDLRRPALDRPGSLRR